MEHNELDVKSMKFKDNLTKTNVKKAKKTIKGLIRRLKYYRFRSIMGEYFINQKVGKYGLVLENDSDTWVIEKTINDLKDFMNELDKKYLRD